MTATSKPKRELFHIFSYFQLRIKVTKICVKINTEFAQLLQTQTRSETRYLKIVQGFAEQNGDLNLQEQIFSQD